MISREMVEGHANHQQILSVMQQHGLVSVQDGQVFLSALAVATVLELDEPVPASRDSEPTAFELRHRLCKDGWEAVNVPSTCSVADKRMMRVQCHGYFSLLLQHVEKLRSLTEQNCFSHNQRQRYYDAVALLVKASPFAPWHCVHRKKTVWLVSCSVVTRSCRAKVLASFHMSCPARLCRMFRQTGMWHSMTASAHSFQEFAFCRYSTSCYGQLG